ncbi:MAG: UDP-galactose-lipid carrier transferase [Ilumatobacteraceae bacterium]
MGRSTVSRSSGGRLAKLDLSKRLNREEYEQRLAAAQRRFAQLRLCLGGHLPDHPLDLADTTFERPTLGPGLAVVFEGPDAAGKGGAIRSIVARLDPRHYEVCSFSAPTKPEKEHHFLWRFWKVLPGLGEMTIYDRSWYGRVLVERVEGFATEQEWQRAFGLIVDFERSLAAEGMIIVKFWLHISDAEQEARFQARAADPFKRWKLTQEDWRNREKNRVYDTAAEEMFKRTGHAQGHWDVIPAEQKRYARVAVLETLNQRVEEGLEAYGIPVPAAVKD